MEIKNHDSIYEDVEGTLHVPSFCTFNDILRYLVDEWGYDDVLFNLELLREEHNGS